MPYHRTAKRPNILTLPALRSAPPPKTLTLLREVVKRQLRAADGVARHHVAKPSFAPLDRIAQLLLAKLDAPEWQCRLKALAVVEAMLKADGTDSPVGILFIGHEDVVRAFERSVK